MENKQDVTFIIHSEWLDCIKTLPVEMQDKIIAEFVRYGAGFPLEHNEDTYVSSMVNMLKGRIDFSKDKYAQKVSGGNKAGRSKKIDENQVYELAKIGKTSQEISVILGCSKSSVDHSQGWKRRKEDNLIFD